MALMVIWIEFVCFSVDSLKLRIIEYVWLFPRGLVMHFASTGLDRVYRIWVFIMVLSWLYVCVFVWEWVVCPVFPVLLGASSGQMAFARKMLLFTPCGTCCVVGLQQELFIVLLHVEKGGIRRKWVWAAQYLPFPEVWGLRSWEGGIGG